MAALTLLSQADTELSLQQHLDLAPDLLQYNRLAVDVESDVPLTMAAQPVPHPSTDKKRVKVYELRNNDWFDRGTGFCTAALNIVGISQLATRLARTLLFHRIGSLPCLLYSIVANVEIVIASSPKMATKEIHE